MYHDFSPEEFLVHQQKPFQKNIKEEQEAIKELMKMLGNQHTSSEVALENSINNLIKEEGLRFNQGKLRLDLVPQSAIDGIAQVLDFGAKKYEENNWRKGMAWSKITSSLKRHLAAIERGEDFDQESGLHHIDHVLTNAAFLKEYYKIYPQGDDRQHRYLNMPKIGLDIDEVLCDWIGAWCQKFGYCKPETWSFSYKNKEHFESFTPEELNEFYLNIPRKIDPNEIPFEPHCYITSRSVPVELTEAWIQKNGFPTAPVYSVGFGVSKVEVAKRSGIDVFVDDRFENFVELNKAGICTYLLSAPHNMRYNVGYKRIKSLKELV